MTKDRIRETGVFSANLITEAMLPLADYLGNNEGYWADKMNINIDTIKGNVLNVPILTCSPWTFELEVSKSVSLDGGEVFLCKIRNVLAEEGLFDEAKGVEQKLQEIAPISTTCSTYFSWNGKKLGAWGEQQMNFTKSK